mmetsp:Transcript_8014/g.26645  ORF Transcript_8014/g.26645 Transcript_8014/m.26645 type:complete len:693 (+) Transcript_8014:83-2161(+)
MVCALRASLLRSVVAHGLVHVEEEPDELLRARAAVDPDKAYPRRLAREGRRHNLRANHDRPELHLHALRVLVDVHAFADRLLVSGAERVGPASAQHDLERLCGGGGPRKVERARVVRRRRCGLFDALELSGDAHVGNVGVLLKPRIGLKDVTGCPARARLGVQEALEEGVQIIGARKFARGNEAAHPPPRRLARLRPVRRSAPQNTHVFVIVRKAEATEAEERHHLQKHKPARVHIGRPNLVHVVAARVGDAVPRGARVDPALRRPLWQRALRVLAREVHRANARIAQLRMGLLHRSKIRELELIDARFRNREEQILHFDVEVEEVAVVQKVERLEKLSEEHSRELFGEAPAPIVGDVMEHVTPFAKVADDEVHRRRHVIREHARTRGARGSDVENVDEVWVTKLHSLEPPRKVELLCEVDAVGIFALLNVVARARRLDEDDALFVGHLADTRGGAPRSSEHLREPTVPKSSVCEIPTNHVTVVEHSPNQRLRTHRETKGDAVGFLLAPAPQLEHLRWPSVSGANGKDFGRGEELARIFHGVIRLALQKQSRDSRGHDTGDVAQKPVLRLIEGRSEVTRKVLQDVCEPKHRCKHLLEPKVLVDAHAHNLVKGFCHLILLLRITQINTDAIQKVSRIALHHNFMSGVSCQRRVARPLHREQSVLPSAGEGGGVVLDACCELVARRLRNRRGRL